MRFRSTVGFFPRGFVGAAALPHSVSSARLARYSLLTQCSGGKVISLFPSPVRPSVRQSTEIRETRVDSFVLNNKEGRVGRPVTAVGGSEWEARIRRRRFLFTRSVLRTSQLQTRGKKDDEIGCHRCRLQSTAFGRGECGKKETFR